jgi:cell wall-associated NlpC family hydrolase
MIRGVHEEQVHFGGKGRPISRRQAISAAVAFGLSIETVVPDIADAAKKHKKRKGGTKEKTKGATGGGGSEVVKVAQKYQGAKYVLGGASPKGFDCSGFTWYVYQQATGMDITRGVEEQWKLGHSVARGEWQAGDIVFFENTFERGLSHVGIFISGNKFIHAENEQTGVVVSELNSDYYSAHYAGARRLL